MLLHTNSLIDGNCVKKQKIKTKISIRFSNEKHLVQCQEQQKDSKNIIKKVYVITCKLTYTPKIGKLCHSGILLQTEENEFYILEYGVGMNHVIYLYKIQNVNDNSNFIIAKSYDKKLDVRWEKQKIGSSLNSCQTINSVQNIMERIISKRKKYNLLNWNCHMAQENTRRSLGLIVKNPYRAIYIDCGITIKDQVSLYNKNSLINF